MFLTKVLKEKTSKFNGQVRAVKTFGTGTYIQSNNLTQSGGIVETIWKKAIKSLVGKNIKVNSCLILGLGGGTVSKLVRQGWPNSEITGVDIDQVIIDFGLEYMNLADQDVNIVVKDAGKYLNDLINNSKKFDLVIVDLYQGDMLPKQFDSESFIKNVSKVLGKNGFCVFNRLSFGSKKDSLSAFESKISKVFKSVDKVKPIANVLFVCQL